MNIGGIKLEKIHDNLWEIPQSGEMKVPGRVYASRQMLEGSISNDEALKQVVNVAHLPGIQKYSLAMPDIHWGYGFPIGGVAATDYDTGVISPGGVGYDINCGVRLAATSIDYNTLKPDIIKLTNNLFNNIPTGVGSSDAIRKLSVKETKDILVNGAKWAVANGFGNQEDLIHTEENGRLKNAEPSEISERALQRGLNQAGTLGSGNHFLEVDVVDEIYDTNTANIMGLFRDQVVIQIHTGSRGLGYQICDDYLKILTNAEKKYGYKLPDRQLACAPVKSDEGRRYLAAMRCAANFAWNNRQIIMHLAKKSLMKTLSISESELRFNLIYDVCHNIAKIEEHKIDGQLKKLCVHRKGATRAFMPGSDDIPPKYKSIGQPVLIPGDMGRYSFVAVGTVKAMNETFGSTCHGAGRLHSRHQAIKIGKKKNLRDEIDKSGIIVRAKGFKTIAEEMPYAYKDVAEVVDVMNSAGISKKIAKLRPIGVIKG